MRRIALAASALALVAPAAAQAYSPNDPLASKQWYLSQDRAFDFWPALPTLPPVRVAVIDSGIDGSHPEFDGRIAAARSFVGGSALTDEEGHGTFVAGEIAAATNNGEGIASVAPSARLLVAKVVTSSGTIPLAAETSAWAEFETRSIPSRTRSPRRREARSNTRFGAALLSWRRSVTETTHRPSPGASRAIRLRFPTSSV